MTTDFKLVSIEKFIKNPNKIYAHWKKLENEEIDNETLVQHSDLSMENLDRIIKSKNLNPVIDKLGKTFFTKEEDLYIWKSLMLNTVYFHDIGKININFQGQKMNNKGYKDQIDFGYSGDHSLYSAYFYIEAMIDTFFKDQKLSEIDKKFRYFLFLNAYIISKHHGSLSDFQSLLEKLEGNAVGNDIIKDMFSEFSGNLVLENKDDLESFTKKVKIKSSGTMEYYIYTRLLFSMVISSDVYSTREYQTDVKTDDYGVLNKLDPIFTNLQENSFNKVQDKEEKKTVFQSIRKYQETRDPNADFIKETNINILRSEMFLEVENSLIENIEKNIFYLEAPTGAGKTITSINLAYQLYNRNPEINKIFYIFPFNTLIEQTKISLEKELGKENLETKLENNQSKSRMAVINSLTPMEISKKLEELDEELDGGSSVEELEKDKKIKKKIADEYETTLMDRDFVHSPLVLTSHVKLFRFLFGTRKNDNFPLLQLANSIIILDEVQSYKNFIWKEIIEFLHKYAELLNIKIIIMSATLPNLSSLISDENKASFEEPVHLIKNREKYFNNPLFKDRVTVDYSMLENNKKKEEILDNIINIIRENPKKLSLIEFQFKKEASQFYDKLKKELGNLLDIELLTGSDSKSERKRIINKVKKLNENIESMEDTKKRERGLALVSTQLIEAGVDIDMELGFKDVSLFDSEEQFLGRINRSCKKDNSKVYFFSLDFKKVANLYSGDARRHEEYSLLNKDIREILRTKDFAQYYKLILDNVKKEGPKRDDFKTHLKNLNFKEIQKYMKLINTPQKYQIFFNRDIKIEDESGSRVLKGQEIWQKFLEAIKIDKIKEFSKRKVKLSQIAEDMSEFLIETYKEPVVRNDKIIAGIYYVEDGEKYFTKNEDSKNKEVGNGKINFEELNKLIDNKNFNVDTDIIG